MAENKFYTQQDLLVACSKLPNEEAESILGTMKLSDILGFINNSRETDRGEWKNGVSMALHKWLNILNGFTRLYDMLPVIDNITDEQKNENVCSDSACDKPIDVVE